MELTALVFWDLNTPGIWEEEIHAADCPSVLVLKEVCLIRHSQTPQEVQFQAVTREQFSDWLPFPFAQKPCWRNCWYLYLKRLEPLLGRHAQKPCWRNCWPFLTKFHRTHHTCCNNAKFSHHYQPSRKSYQSKQRGRKKTWVSHGRVDGWELQHQTFVGQSGLPQVACNPKVTR